MVCARQRGVILHSGPHGTTRVKAILLDLVSRGGYLKNTSKTETSIHYSEPGTGPELYKFHRRGTVNRLDSVDSIRSPVRPTLRDQLPPTLFIHRDGFRSSSHTPRTRSDTGLGPYPERLWEGVGEGRQNVDPCSSLSLRPLSVP